MQDKPNVPLLILLVILGLGILIASGGFDDASVRDLENQQALKIKW